MTGHSHSDRSYRPLSGLAVAGFVLAVGFSAVLAVLAVVTWTSGQPALAGWLVPVAALAAALSFAGVVHVRRSEGTRAGRALARWGLWLSTVGGLGYAAYYLATELAVRQQARDFSSTWFDRLTADDLAGAFLLTVPPAQRQGDHPQDRRRLQARYLEGPRGGKGPWPIFHEQPLVTLLRQAGPAARIESLGIEGWQLLGPAYLVEQNYRVTTPEGIYDFRLPVVGAVSTDPERGFHGRQWHVLWNDLLTVQPRRLTPLGQSMLALRQSGARFVADWALLLERGQWSEAYLETQAPAARQPVAHAVAGRQAAAAFAAPTAPVPGLTLAWQLGDGGQLGWWSEPGYARFRQGALLHTDGLMAGNANRDAVVRAAADLFRPAGAASVVLELPPEPIRTDSLWDLDDERLRLRQPVRLRLGTRFLADGVAEVVAADPDLVRRLRELLAGEGAGSALDVRRTPPWQLRRIDLTFAFANPPDPNR